MQRVMSNGLKIVVLIVVTNSVFGKPQLLAKPVNSLERYKRQAEVSPSCSLECLQQGSECQVENGIAKCACISCVIPITNMFTCATNNLVYFSPCFMNRAACQNSISLHEIDCLPSSSTERPDNDLTTSRASTEINKLTMEANHVTYYQKCIENYIVQWRNCNEYEYDARNRTVGFVHKNGKCKRRILSFCPATHNHYKSRKECLDTCENPCTKPISDEVCSKDYKMRFKFVVESKQCEVFVYWGCGNAGFKTAEICKDVCNRNNNLPNRCSSTCSQNADKLTMEANHVTYYQKCIENYIVQWRNCNEYEYDARNRTVGFVHKNGKCKGRILSFCPATHNHYKSRKECLDTCENPCTKPISDEVCSKDYKMRLKFVVESKQCEVFVYLGCGNAGFKTVERCKDVCIRNNAPPNRCSSTCSQNADKFTIKTNHVPYYQKCNEDYRVQLKNCNKYDVRRRTRGFVHENGKCKRKKHKFCSAMHNHYKSRKECLNTCQNPCTKPISDEICSNNVRARLRFKFDVKSKQCKNFVYLGCGKAGFKTVERCKDVCIRNITLPKRCSSTCSQNARRLFCTQDFVVAGKLKRITNCVHENPRRQLFVKLTRVFKDNHQLRLFSRIENLSSEATLYMNINTDRECPCPNIARKLALNKSYPDNEFVISGMVLDGMATLNQGSFVKVATRELIKRMDLKRVEDSPEKVYGRFCNNLRRNT